MAEIDDYYDLIMGRKPASEIIPEGAKMFAPAPETEAEINVLHRTPSVKFPIADTYKKNVEDSILAREANAREIRERMQEPNAQSAKRMAEAESTLARLSAPQAAYSLNPEIEAQIEKAKSGAEAKVDQPRDMLSEVILSFGPAVLGAFGGESGQIAQLKAGQEARTLYEARRKESIESAKAARDNAQKRYDALLKIKQSDRESFDKTQQREIDKLKGVLSAQVDFTKMSEDKANKLADQYNKAVESSSAATEKAAKELADLEKFPQEQAAKEERAKILANIAQQKANTPTQGEREAAGFASMVRKANAELSRIGGADGSQLPSLKDPLFTQKANIMSGETPGSGLLENLIRDPATRSQLQAEIDWAMTTLRDESGAAIGRSEAIKQLNRYFPRYGDTPEVIAQKGASRQQKENAIVAAAGRAEIPKVEAPQGVEPGKKQPLKPLTKQQLKGMSFEEKQAEARRRGLIK